MARGDFNIRMIQFNLPLPKQYSVLLQFSKKAKVSSVKLSLWSLSLTWC